MVFHCCQQSGLFVLHQTPIPSVIHGWQGNCGHGVLWKGDEALLACPGHYATQEAQFPCHGAWCHRLESLIPPFQQDGWGEGIQAVVPKLLGESFQPAKFSGRAARVGNGSSIVTQ